MTRSRWADEDLVAACAAGDEQALGVLYDRFGTVAYRLALRVVRDATLAEDVVQEAYLAAWRQAARFDGSRGTVSAWLLTLVHRRAVDQVRRHARTASRPERVEATPARGGGADEDVVLREARREVQAALSTLSRADREVLELAYWGGLTQSEIADRLGIPSGTVKTRTFRALTRLRAALCVQPTEVCQGGLA
jgi:RNA polymerase sigma-70 factor (ECF subfamily)